MLWKGLIEEMFDDLLRFMFPGIDEDVDFSQGIQFLDKEFGALDPSPGSRSPTREVDKLVKVFTCSGRERELLFHVEFQGNNVQDFSHRMYQYHYRISDKHSNNLSSIAIFTGRDGHKMPVQYEKVIHGSKSSYQYNCIILSALSVEDLVQSENPFALVLLAAKPLVLKPGTNEEDALLERKVQVNLLAHREGFCSKATLKVILLFLENYIIFKDPNKEKEYIKRTSVNDKSNHMGILEQVAEMKAEIKAKKIVGNACREARQKEKVHVVKALCAQTDLSFTKISEIVGLPVQQVEKIKKLLQ